MAHIGIKKSSEVKFDFDIKNLMGTAENKKKSLEMLKSYQESNKYADDYDRDLLLITEDSIITAFDYIYKGQKLMMPEINPVTIYYSNAVMSNFKIKNYKNILISKSKEGIIDSHVFGNFFQLAFNCIINLQSSVETFLNYILNENKYVFYDKNNKVRKSSIHEKIEIALPEIFNKTFKDDYSKQITQIKDLISIRNEMIHLKPDKEETNSKYKVPYRKILDFNFDETVEAVKVFINYHQNSLIEECNCGRDFYFDIIS